MKKYYIVDMSQYGQGEAVSLFESKRGRILASYTDEPEYYDSYEEAADYLKSIEDKDFDYSFSLRKEVREQHIKFENLEIEEYDFEDED